MRLYAQPHACPCLPSYNTLSASDLHQFPYIFPIQTKCQPNKKCVSLNFKNLAKLSIVFKVCMLHLIVTAMCLILKNVAIFQTHAPCHATLSAAVWYKPACIAVQLTVAITATATAQHTIRLSFVQSVTYYSNGLNFRT